MRVWKYRQDYRITGLQDSGSGMVLCGKFEVVCAFGNTDRITGLQDSGSGMVLCGKFEVVCAFGNSDRITGLQDYRKGMVLLGLDCAWKRVLKCEQDYRIKASC
jgi:hypothetical protein